VGLAQLMEWRFYRFLTTVFLKKGEVVGREA
jgi:hypothetical protein